MSSPIDAVILAGGRATRMGGQDKGLVALNGKPMICYAIDRLKPQVSRLFINANRNQQDYQAFGLSVFTDTQTGYLGPLAGIVSGLQHSQSQYLLTAPCDCPLLPTDLASKMLTALKQHNADLAVATDGIRQQPVVMLLKTHLLDSIQKFLDDGQRKIDCWYAGHHVVEVSFADQPFAFANINTPEQIQQFSQQLSR